MFFVISLILGNQTADKEKGGDEWQNLEAQVVEAVETDVPAATPAPESDVPAAEPEENDVPN
ncbi:hypothetical protein [Paraglaciecola sp.]|uniref:hypothetical protein n=1 Tax=Paraglaciecola sp. TaxID=1920173 RepID=UPI003F4AD22B